MKWSRWFRLNHESVIARHVTWVPLLTLSSIAYAGSPIGSSPVWLGTTGDTLFFIAQPASSNGSAALFKSDGTASGTTQLAPIDGVGVLTYQAGTLFLSAGTKSYFLANTTADGQQVWVTDGTSAGTRQVTDIIATDQTYGTPIQLGIIGTNLIYAQVVSDNTMQLFLTDGTAAGTTTISSFAQTQYGLVSDSLAINGKIHIALESSVSCCEPDLWSTDSTIAGTVRIDSNEGYPTFHLQPSSLRAFGQSVALLTNTFTYTVKDLQGALSNVATVNVTVTAASSSSTSSAGHGGGGSTTLLDLLALGGCVLVRRACRSSVGARTLLTHARVRER